MNHNSPDAPLRAYLLGKLPPPEKEALEERLAQDAKLAQTLELERLEMAAAELLIAAETRQHFANWSATRPRSFLGIKMIHWCAGLAATLMLLFVAIQLLNPTGDPEKTVATEKIIPQRESPITDTPPVESLPSNPPPPTQNVPKPGKNSNFRALAQQQLPAPLLPNLRRTTADSTTSPFQQAQLAFAAGQFQQTLDLLKHSDSTRQQATAFLTAHALFQLERYAEAEAQFEQLLRWNSKQFRYQSEWGVLMCRLANYEKQPDLVRRQLDTILSQPQHPYAEQAKALQKVLPQ
ncbi:MAG: CDC27 family protein [Saprospiraceae bacterium]|nr:CDC27 family protein [Saprospiraceae bacterium]